MSGVTYSLREKDQTNSNKYYKIIESFADEVLKEAYASLSPMVGEYHGYVNSIKGEPQNAKEETILEIIILGVLMRLYYPRAIKLKGMQYKLLTWINETRRRSEKLKPEMNFLKGKLSTLFLFPNTQCNSELIDLKVTHLSKLILWLEASGEFYNEVKRLRRWEAYLRTISDKKASAALTSAYKFATWFEGRSNESLGEYTSHVDEYLEKSKNSWREDRLFRERRRVEYHLNMVGAEIMNMAFRKAFIATNKKVLLLPVCMTSPSKSRCQAQAFGRGFQCKACSTKCQVNQLSRLGEKTGFRVMVIPHESSVSSGSEKQGLFDENTGVIGVACVLNLISGGWLLKDMNIPAQCVLLDNCGCKAHWHDKGISTCININKLQEILK